MIYEASARNRRDYAAILLVRHLDQHRLLSQVGMATPIDARALHEAHEQYTKERS